MNKKSIISFILAVIAVSLFGQKQITLMDIWGTGAFYPQNIYGFESTSDGKYYAMITVNGIEKYEYATGKQAGMVLSMSDLKNAGKGIYDFKRIDGYSLNKQGTKILIATESESIYRSSTQDFFFIYDLENNSLQPLSDMEKGKQRLAEFSPDGNNVAFVRDNNLFIKDLKNNIEIQITSDGLQNQIINGTTDWVYEEELDITKGFEWSSDGKKIAFMRFDERNVKEFSMTIWGDLYPEEYRYKYPKAGEDNSLVDIYIYDLPAKTKVKVDLGDNSNCYFPRIHWMQNPHNLVIYKLNRHQNKLEFIKYDTDTKTTAVMYTDENERWLDVTEDVHFLTGDKHLITTSERDGYNHIYFVEFGGKITQLTKGNWEVAEICHVDEQKKLIYYVSNESGTLNRELYSIQFDGKKKKMLSVQTGWNTVQFDAHSNYFINRYSNADTPPVITINDRSGKTIRALQDNKELVQRMKEYGFTKKEFFSFTTSENVLLNGWMIKPATFDPAKKYPVLMYVYGGPGSQEVNNSYFRGMDFAWYQMLAQKGYIVVCVDNRGTKGRGDDFKKSVYKQLGKYEVIDQIEAAKYLGQLPYVDKSRIGIWGWSYGGYMSTNCITQGNGIFKMAIAVAPVTNWRYYDNIYTERFMQTPQENPSGYDDNSPISHANKLKGQYLIVHGTADDNVHFQNAIDMVTALNRAGIQYEQFFYPNKNHFIVGGNTRLHLYTKLTKFIEDNL